MEVTLTPAVPSGISTYPIHTMLSDLLKGMLNNENELFDLQELVDQGVLGVKNPAPIRVEDPPALLRNDISKVSPFTLHEDAKAIDASGLFLVVFTLSALLYVTFSLFHEKAVSEGLEPPPSRPNLVVSRDGMSLRRALTDIFCNELGVKNKNIDDADRIKDIDKSYSYEDDEETIGSTPGNTPDRLEASQGHLQRTVDFLPVKDAEDAPHKHGLKARLTKLLHSATEIFNVESKFERYQSPERNLNNPQVPIQLTSQGPTPPPHSDSPVSRESSSIIMRSTKFIHPDDKDDLSTYIRESRSMEEVELEIGPIRSMSSKDEEESSVQSTSSGWASVAKARAIVARRMLQKSSSREVENEPQPLTPPDTSFLLSACDRAHQSTKEALLASALEDVSDDAYDDDEVWDDPVRALNIARNEDMKVSSSGTQGASLLTKFIPDIGSKSKYKPVNMINDDEEEQVDEEDQVNKHVKKNSSLAISRIIPPVEEDDMDGDSNVPFRTVMGCASSCASDMTRSHMSDFLPSIIASTRPRSPTSMKMHLIPSTPMNKVSRSPPTTPLEIIEDLQEHEAELSVSNRSTSRLGKSQKKPKPKRGKSPNVKDVPTMADMEAELNKTPLWSKKKRDPVVKYAVDEIQEHDSIEVIQEEDDEDALTRKSAATKEKEQDDKHAATTTNTTNTTTTSPKSTKDVGSMKKDNREIRSKDLGSSKQIPDVNDDLATNKATIEARKNENSTTGKVLTIGEMSTIGELSTRYEMSTKGEISTQGEISTLGEQSTINTMGASTILETPDKYDVGPPKAIALEETADRYHVAIAKRKIPPPPPLPSSNAPSGDETDDDQTSVSSIDRKSSVSLPYDEEN